MSKLEKYLSEQIIISEKLIQYGIHSGGNPKYGNITIVVGGAGAGKNYVVNNFLDAVNYKIYDVDQMKELVMHLNQVKGKYPELNSIDMSNPKDVFDLHSFVKDKIRDKVITQFFNTRETGRLPNLLFNIAGKSTSAIKNYVDLAVEAGYKTENINLLYVLNDIDVQIENNATRDRRVGIHVLIATTTGAAATFINTIRRPPKNIGGRIDCVVNLKSLTKKMKSVQGGSFISDFEYVNLKKPNQSLNVNTVPEIEDMISSLVWRHFSTT